MNAAMVCVNYSDLLAVTLPYNRHHFEQVLVVTSPNDTATQELAVEYGCTLHVTDAFYARGAKFNKWAALEEGLDARDFRHGWLCLLDADVLWPKQLTITQAGSRLLIDNICLDVGQLCSPLRYMAPWPTMVNGIAYAVPPAEELWHTYNVHRNIAEWAGYSQIFHCDDPALGLPPWHEVDWTHAGGADSVFQRKWTAANKVRPPWRVLHLGETGENWFGRSTQLADGTRLPGSAVRRQAYLDLWPARRAVRAAGGDEAAIFAPEKLPSAE